MKKIFTVLFLVSSFAFGQNGFYQVDFESSSGYSTSISEFTDGGGDFFIRTDGANIGSYYSVTGMQGTSYFAGMDIDGEGASLPVTLDITGVSIAGHTGLQLGLLIAEDDDAANEDWDDSDYMHIAYNIDAGGWQELLWIENDGTQFNTAPQIDDDFNGDGEGTTITSTFTEFIRSIPGTGSSIDIRITFNLNSGDEDIAIDNIRLGSNETPLPVELTTFSASVIDNNIELNWETATEVNNYGFNVERASAPLSMTSPKDWNKVGFVEGHGNSNSPKNYSFVDNTVHNTGKYFYRLKQVDIDGSYEYSSMVEVDLTAQLEYKLKQNFPNPFNPTTSIQFSLPEASQVKLVVFNVIGEQVAELVNKSMEAGNHNVEFNASELNSGIYVYKIEANGFVQIRKMMLVK